MTGGRRIDVVMTTVGDAAEFFAAYEKAAAGHRVRLVVIPDRKTPEELFANCARARAAGLDVLCPTVAEQDELLARAGARTLVPYDSDNRRNIGYLLSLGSDAELLISVDDDNFPADDDFFDRHSVVAAGVHDVRVVDAASGWWNPCDMLEVEPMPVYPRGFPYRHRAPAPTPVAETVRPVDVRVNAGLWLGDPDVDAITRIAVQPRVLRLLAPEAVLGESTWAPVNSQNTAVHRDAVPAYYFPRMGYRHHGQPIDRYADIFSGLFLQACAKHLGHGIRFGSPVSTHDRNVHRLLQDLRQELTAIEMLEDLLEWLVSCRLDGSTYRAAYESLAHQLHDAAEGLSGPWWTPDLRGFLHEMAYLMRQWLHVADRFSAGGVSV